MKLFFLIIQISFLINDLSANLITKKANTRILQGDVVPQKTAENSMDQSNLECNQSMMIAYGMTGFNSPQLTTHKFCPMITHNCCTPQDETMSMEIWNSQARYLVEKYYETYLYSIKYVLGFSQEGMNLAKDFENDTNVACKNAALDYLDMNMNPRVTQDIYKAFVISLERMGEIRRGFFCILCDARTQSRLKDFWASTNLFYRDRIYFSKDFCRKLVENTIRSSYFTVFYLKRYADRLGELINCKTKRTTEVIYDIPFWTQQQVKNCYYFKEKYFFFFCEKYCEKFHLAKPNSIFDGDLGELKKFVDLIMQTRHEVFDYPDNNMLMNGLTYEEEILRHNYEDVFTIDVFFKSSTGNVQLEKFQTDVVYWGGMDPWESCENSMYELVLARSNMLAVTSTLALILTWLL